MLLSNQKCSPKIIQTFKWLCSKVIRLYDNTMETMLVFKCQILIVKRICINNSLCAVWTGPPHCTDTQATINQVLLLFSCIFGLNLIFFFILKPFTAIPPSKHHITTHWYTCIPTGIFWYKQLSLSWLIKANWTCIVRVHARTEESEQPTYLHGHQALRVTEQCVNRIKYILAFDDSCTWIPMA